MFSSNRAGSRFNVDSVQETDESGGEGGGGDRNKLELPQLNEYGIMPEMHSTHQDKYLLSLRRLTREVLPQIELYRDARSIHAASRPSLDELHNEGTTAGIKKVLDDASEEKPGGEGVKFGWITGVMIRCLLNIWGPIMFLRLTAIVGRCGIVQSIMLILLADVITVITGLSISAISTNGLVKGGGTYYLISRSLGPEYGGAIGLIFAFANAVAVSMHTVGFSESMRDLLKSQDLSIVDSGPNDMRIIGVITVCVLVTITIVGMEWEQKAQVVLLVILLVAIVDVVVGSFMPEEEEKAKGFVGWSSDVISKNMDSDYRGETFFSQFSIFFPACTGILAGANISGDLKDPSSAIPKGTLLAILFSSLVYIMFCVVAGSTVYRDATGSLADLANGTAYNCTGRTCEYGLWNNYQVMELVAAFGYLVYAGCFAATLSSALACLVSAPKIFQALANDKIYPKLEWFGKGFGKSGEPIRSYLLAFLVAVIFILVGDLNTIAPIISNFFMAAYCLINFACFHAALAKSPGFRPGFRFWNKWVSLIGALLSMGVTFIMSWQTALATFFLCFFLYIYLTYKKPDVNWGSSQQAVSYRSALKAVQDLVQVEDHVKNYRPQILALTGKVFSRPALVDLGYHITKGIGLMVCGDVRKTVQNHKERSSIIRSAYSWLYQRKVKAFYCLVQDETMAHGAKALIQASGVGKLSPNMVLMGFMNNWQNRTSEDILDYFNTLHAAFDLHLAVGILRVEQGLDFSFFTDEKEPPKTNGMANGRPVIKREESNASLASVVSEESTVSVESAPTPTPPAVNTNPEGKKQKKKEEKDKTPPKPEIPKEILNSIDLFRSKPTRKDKGTIDVWWLYDDGGLTLLIPYILTTRKFFQNEKLRVFSLANKNDEIDQQQLNLASLLSRFRIDCQDVTVLPDITKKPKEHSIREFDLSISKFRQEEDDEECEEGITITEAEYLELQQKTLRYIRIRELLLQHSRQAKTVFVTMPMPRKNRVSATLYLSWLDALSRDMPPTVLIRGNQTSVLTFYS